MSGVSQVHNNTSECNSSSKIEYPSRESSDLATLLLLLQLLLLQLLHFYNVTTGVASRQRSKVVAIISQAITATDDDHPRRDVHASARCPGDLSSYRPQWPAEHLYEFLARAQLWPPGTAVHTGSSLCMPTNRLRLARITAVSSVQWSLCAERLYYVLCLSL